MFAPSIRFRITLFYTAILTVTLLAFSVVVYQNFSRSLWTGLDGLLKSKAQGVSDSIEAYWEAEASVVETQPARAVARNKINNLNFLRIVRRWIEENSQDPDLINVLVQIFDANGELIAGSRGTAEIPSLEPERLGPAAKGRSGLFSQDVVLAGAGPEPVRFFLMPVIEQSRLTYIVQVGSPLLSLTSTLNRLKTLLFLILPSTVILTGLAGLWLVRLTLKPVDRMVRTLSEVKANRLGMRLRLPRAHDEIRRLAETFNDLLSRLETDFLRQSQFSQDLSHELRTPLTILRGELEVSLKKARAPREYQAVLRRGLGEVETISRILDQLLVLARWENSEIPLRWATFDLAALSERVLRDFRRAASARRLRLVHSGTGPLLVSGDEGQVRTALSNLLDNAVKYTDKGGRIDVAVAKEKGMARLVVRDTGMGIPADKLPHVFDRFYRAEESRTSPGVGLGLSIVRSIIQAHGGTVRVESRPGEGTTFTLTLPRPTKA